MNYQTSYETAKVEIEIKINKEFCSVCYDFIHQNKSLEDDECRLFNSYLKYDNGYYIRCKECIEKEIKG